MIRDNALIQKHVALMVKFLALEAVRGGALKGLASSLPDVHFLWCRLSLCRALFLSPTYTQEVQPCTSLRKLASGRLIRRQFLQGRKHGSERQPGVASNP